jgi:hypothetical protein
LRVASNWSSRYAGLGAQGNISVPRKRAHGPVGIQDENEFANFGANLRSPSGAARADEGWAGPPVPSACDDHALATLPAESESNFDHGEDRETSRIPHHAPRDSLFRHPFELAENKSRLVYNLLFGGSGRHGEREKANGEQCADGFHDYI